MPARRECWARLETRKLLSTSFFQQPAPLSRRFNSRVDILQGKQNFHSAWERALARAKSIFPGMSEDEVKEKIGNVFCEWADSKIEEV